MDANIKTILRDRFGLRSLYPLQEQIIRRILAGGDALVVMPTGSGKSLCFQLPALALPGPGVALVFSPLIALMEDQVAALRRKNIRAEFINSTLDRRTRESRYAALADGAYELIYVTPERMEKPEFVAALEAVGVKLLAVDETHCITKWGHDFRPAYQEIGRFRRDLGAPVTVALTATATPAVREDVRRTLQLGEDEMPLFAAGIDRPNLSFAARQVWRSDEKIDAILGAARNARGTGIVYCSLIRSLEDTAREVRAVWGPARTEIYHGRLPAAEKRRVYDRFIASPPEDSLVLLATNAFGMGVDKPDIRFVIHAQMPGSVESYYQEIGRAGRDGEPSHCELLYDESDLAIQQEFLEWMNPSAELLARAAHAFQANPFGDLSVDELREAIVHRSSGDRCADYCVITLEKMGVIEPSPHEGRFQFVRPLREQELDSEEIDAKKKRDLCRLFDMLKIARCDDIRAAILEYFDLDGDPRGETP